MMDMDYHPPKVVEDRQQFIPSSGLLHEGRTRSQVCEPGRAKLLENTPTWGADFFGVGNLRLEMFRN